LAAVRVDLQQSDFFGFSPAQSFEIQLQARGNCDAQPRYILNAAVQALDVWVRRGIDRDSCDCAGMPPRTVSPP
jgi:hypothetical protein